MRLKLTPTRIRCMKPGSRERIEWDSLVPHLGVRVRPNGTKRFVHRITIRGKIHKKSLGHVDAMTIEEARNLARQIDVDLLESHASTKPVLKPEKVCPTFGEFAMETWLPLANRNKKLQSIQRNNSALSRYLLPQFGHLPVDGITRTVVLKWFDKCSRRHPGGANRVLETLSTILNLAIRHGIIATNPTKTIARNPARKFTRFLSGEERTRLLDALDQVPEVHVDHADAIRLLLFTGCRKSEILKLRWDEVEESRINLTESKTGPRPVWLGEEALAVLDRRRSAVLSASAAGILPSPFVFPHRSNREASLGGVPRFWNNLRRNIGLREFRMHDLRHSFATEAVRQGVPLPIVSKLLGHKNIAMTMRYAHVCDAEAEETAERLGLHINALIEGIPSHGFTTAQQKNDHSTSAVIVGLEFEY